MKVCIPIAFNPHGGGFYFLRAFAHYLGAHGHHVVVDVAEAYDVLVTSHWLVPRGEVLKGLRKNPDARVMQRIDGAAEDYGRDPEADRRQRAVNRLADLTIFQSEYARRATRERFRVIEQDGPVIHNPVDVHAFTQEGGRLPLPEARRVVSVSWSMNPKKGAAAVYATAARNPDVGFYLCGRYEHVPALPNLHQLGVINHDQLPAVLRSCHALLTYSENEACPNHVLEALATGLPVLYRDSGAMSEVIGGCGVAVEPDTCGAAIEDVMHDWTDWSRRARARAMTCFLPDQVFSRYVAEMTAACERPPRTGRAWRQVRAWTGVFS